MSSGVAATPRPSPFRSTSEREIERSEKREAVLRAAARLFNERGFHTTSLDDVAASLGVTRPVVYHYLGNKDRVLLECVRRGLELLRAAAEAVRARPGRGVDRLRAFLVRYAEINMDDFGRCVIRTVEESLAPASAAEFRRMKAEIDRALRRMIEEAVADGSAETDDVRMTAFAFAGALNWPARWHRPDGELPATEIADRLVGTLLAGVLPRTDRPERRPRPLHPATSRTENDDA